MQLKALKNNIVFIFKDEVVGGMFQETTSSGIVLTKYHENTAKEPRWGTVVTAGPDCSDDIYPGQEVLVEPLMWTEGILFEGQKLWRTDETKVLGVAH